MPIINNTIASKKETNNVFKRVSVILNVRLLPLDLANIIKEISFVFLTFNISFSLVGATGLEPATSSTPY